MFSLHHLVKCVRTPYLALLDGAEEAERTRDLEQWRSCLRQAFEAADRASSRSADAAGALARFHLKTLNIESFLTLEARARSHWRRWSEAFVSDLRADAAFYMSAHRALRAWVESGRLEGAAQPIVLVSSAATNWDNRGADVRRAYRAVAAALDGAGAPYAFAARLTTAHETLMPPDARFIGYHSISPGRQCLNFKGTDQPRSYSFDPHGYSGWSSLAETPIEALALERYAADAPAFIAAERERIIANNVSKYAQADQAEALEPGYVFVGLQTIDDTVQQLAHLPMLEMLAEVSAACRERGVRVVVKRHPHCRSGRVTAALRAGLARGDFVVSTNSVHKLIAGACAVCVVNSGVGAEALLHMKPVYAFGRSEYHHVCHRITERGAFARVFEPDKLPVSPETIERFLCYFRTEFSVDATDEAKLQPFVARRVEQFLQAAAAPAA
jgi:hypothetical protein